MEESQTETREILRQSILAPTIAKTYGKRIPNHSELLKLCRQYDLMTVNKILAQSCEIAEGQNDFFKLLKKTINVKPKSFEIVLVPGWFSFSLQPMNHTIKDRQRWSRDLGFQTEVVDLSSQATVAANAYRLANFLKNHSGAPRILVSSSQASFELKYFFNHIFSKDPSLYRSIRGWLNISGLINGSRSVQFFSRSWSWRFYRLYRDSQFWSRQSTHNPLNLAQYGVLSDLAKESTKIPPDFLICSIPGLTDPRSVPYPLKKTATFLSHLEPHDGLFTFEEMVIRQGVIIPIVGMTHLSEEAFLRPVFERVLKAMYDILA